jgi:hypothetical protein
LKKNGILSERSLNLNISIKKNLQQQQKECAVLLLFGKSIIILGVARPERCQTIFNISEFWA